MSQIYSSHFSTRYAPLSAVNGNVLKCKLLASFANWGVGREIVMTALALSISNKNNDVYQKYGGNDSSLLAVKHDYC